MAETRVLVAGAINSDLVSRVTRVPGPGETVTGDGFAIFGGGKGANQAVAAARSGARVSLLGAVGGDAFGRDRLSELAVERIDVSAVAVIAGAASGTASIWVEPGGENRILYVPGATTKVTERAALDLIERMRPAVVLTTLELPVPVLTALFTRARALGITVVLNATPEPEAGRGLLALVDVVIVNEPEAAAMLGGDAGGTDGTEAARGLLESGPKSVVLTLGGEGATLIDASGTESVAAPAVEVVDTTAAGDALCGAFAAELATGKSPAEALRYGVVAGSLAVTRQGAQPSIPTRAQIDARARKTAKE